MTATSASFPAMGTMALVRVRMSGDPRPALRAAEQTVAGLEEELSRFRPDSDVSRLNRGAGAWTAVGPHTAELAGRCPDLMRRTLGAFNPLLDGSVAPTDIEVAEGRVRIPPGCALDFGGVGKGYAADRALAACLAAGAERALVSIGTSSLAVGPAGAEPAVVSIDTPFLGEPASLGQLRFRGSLSVSGGRGLRRGEHSITSHLIDPATMQPARTDVAAVAVVGPDGVAAEAFSTALVVHGRDRALSLGLVEEVAMVLCTVEGRILASPSIAADFRIDHRSFDKALGRLAQEPGVSGVALDSKEFPGHDGRQLERSRGAR